MSKTTLDQFTVYVDVELHKPEWENVLDIITTQGNSNRTFMDCDYALLGAKFKKAQPILDNETLYKILEFLDCLLVHRHCDNNQRIVIIGDGVTVANVLVYLPAAVDCMNDTESLKPWGAYELFTSRVLEALNSVDGENND